MINGLKQNNSLTWLDLSSNFIDEKGGNEIASYLATNTSLTFLDLSLNPIGQRAATKIMEALQTNNSLTSLNLGSCQLYGELTFIDASLKTLETNTCLSDVDLFNNNYSQEDKNKIDSKLLTNCL